MKVNNERVVSYGDARSGANGFTLIELLVTIAIVAALAITVVLVLQPAELLRQTRDAERMSDLGTLDRALALYATDILDPYMGAEQTVYVSLVDPQATSSSGTNCASMGLPALPLLWNYHCAASSTLRNVDGTGWIPIDWRQVSFDAPLAILPVDPVNATSSGLYYTYNAGSWDLTAVMESVKYREGGSNSVVASDGGMWGNLFEMGTNLSLLPVGRPATSSDIVPPTVTITSPLGGTIVSSTITIIATSSDNILVAGVQFLLDGGNLGAEVITPPYQLNWNTGTAINGTHTLTAVARDNSWNTTASSPVIVTVSGSSAQAPALVQFAVTSDAPGNVCSLQLSTPVTAGNLLVLTVSTNSSTAAVVAQGNLGNVWQSAGGGVVSNAGTQELFYASNVAGGITNTTATITNWGDAFRSCQLAEYSGVSTLDTGSSWSGSGTSLASGTSTTNFGTELIVAGGSLPGCPTCGFSAGPGFTIVAASLVSFQEYTTTTSAGAYSATAWLSSSTPWLMTMAAFH